MNGEYLYRCYVQNWHEIEYRSSGRWSSFLSWKQLDDLQRGVWEQMAEMVNRKDEKILRLKGQLDASKKQLQEFIQRRGEFKRCSLDYDAIFARPSDPRETFHVMAEDDEEASRISAIMHYEVPGMDIPTTGRRHKASH